MNNDEKSFDELCSKLRTLGIEYTDGETTEPSSIPQPLGEPANVLAEGPFFWKPTNEELDKLYAIISKAKECEDDPYDLRKFSIYLTLAYELYLNGNTVLAKNVMDKVENRINFEFTPIPDAVRCVFSSCKGYLLEKLGKHEEAKEVFKVLEDKVNMDDKNKAILLVIKSYVCSQYGYEGSKKALIYAKEALKLDPTNAECNFLVGKYMGRLRHVEEPYTIPSKEEMVYLEKASECQENSNYMVFTAQIYRETSSRIFSKFGKNLNETIKSHIEVLNSKAANMFRKSAELRPNNVSILFRCANGLMKLPNPHRDVNTAWKLLSKALEMSPGNLYGCHTAAQYFMKYEPNPIEARKYLKICTDNNVYGAYMNVMSLDFSKYLGDVSKNFENMFALLLVNFPIKGRKIQTYMLMAEYYSLVNLDVVKTYGAISNVLELDPQSVGLLVYRPHLIIMNGTYSPIHLLLHDLENAIKIDPKNLALNQMNKTFRKKMHALELDITRKPEEEVLAARELFKRNPGEAIRHCVGSKRRDILNIGRGARGKRGRGRGSRGYNNNNNNRQMNYSNNQKTESMRGGRGRRQGNRGNWSKSNFGNRGGRRNDEESNRSNNDSLNIGLEKKTIPSLLELNFQNNTKQDRDFKTNEAMRDKPNVQTGGHKNKFHPAISSDRNRSDHAQLGVQDRSGRNAERKESNSRGISSSRNKTYEQYKGPKSCERNSRDRRRDRSMGSRRRSYSGSRSNSRDRGSERSMDSRRRYHRHTRESSRDSRRSSRDRKRYRSMDSRRRYHRHNGGSSDYGIREQSRGSHRRFYSDSRSNSPDSRNEWSTGSRRRHDSSRSPSHDRKSVRSVGSRQRSHSQSSNRSLDRRSERTMSSRRRHEHRSLSRDRKSGRSVGSHRILHSQSRSSSRDRKSVRSIGSRCQNRNKSPERSSERSVGSRRRHDHRNPSRDRESIRSIGSRRRSRSQSRNKSPDRRSERSVGSCSGYKNHSRSPSIDKKSVRSVGSHRGHKNHSISPSIDKKNVRSVDSRRRSRSQSRNKSPDRRSERSVGSRRGYKNHSRSPSIDKKSVRSVDSRRRSRSQSRNKSPDRRSERSVGSRRRSKNHSRSPSIDKKSVRSVGSRRGSRSQSRNKSPDRRSERSVGSRRGYKNHSRSPSIDKKSVRSVSSRRRSSSRNKNHRRSANNRGSSYDRKSDTVDSDRKSSSRRMGSSHDKRSGAKTRSSSRDNKRSSGSSVSDLSERISSDDNSTSSVIKESEHLTRFSRSSTSEQYDNRKSQDRESKKKKYYERDYDSGRRRDDRHKSIMKKTENRTSSSSGSASYRRGSKDRRRGDDSKGGTTTNKTLTYEQMRKMCIEIMNSGK